jgi:hypothetical protein
MPSAKRCAATASMVSASVAADARRATIPIAVSSDHADVPSKLWAVLPGTLMLAKHEAGRHRILNKRLTDERPLLNKRARANTTRSNSVVALHARRHRESDEHLVFRCPSRDRRPTPLRLSARHSVSASGQKRTSQRVGVMSALPPKADIHPRQLDVRFVPVTDITN